MDTKAKPPYRDPDRRQDLDLDLTVSAVFAVLTAAFLMIAGLQ